MNKLMFVMKHSFNNICIIIKIKPKEDMLARFLMTICAPCRVGFVTDTIFPTFLPIETSPVHLHQILRSPFFNFPLLQTFYNPPAPSVPFWFNWIFAPKPQQLSEHPPRINPALYPHLPSILSRGFSKILTFLGSDNPIAKSTAKSTTANAEQALT